MPSFHKGGAFRQIFHFNKWRLSYGTVDKGYAASLILSIGLLFTIIILIIFGSIFERNWISDALKILGPALSFVAGVSFGKSMDSKKTDQ